MGWKEGDKSFFRPGWGAQGCDFRGLGGEFFAGGGDGEFAVFHTFGGDQGVGDLADDVARAAHEEDFQLVMVVIVNVNGGQDHEDGWQASPVCLIPALCKLG